MIIAFLTGLHVLICVVLILVVLLQSGKGGGLAGAFGGMGGAGQSLFGGRGAATFLSKATTVLGVAFMSSSLILALMAGSTAPKSVIRSGPQAAPGAAPPVNTQPLQIPGSDNLTLPPPEGTQPGAEPGTPAETAPQGTQSAPAEQPAPQQPTNDSGGN